RTDIFAFGCVLYEMITGRRAFDGDDVSEILGSVLKIDPDWSVLPEATPAAVRRLLRVCLEKNMKNRRGTAADVRIDLEEASKELHESAAPATVQSTRRSAAGWIVVAVLLVSTAVLSIAYFRPQPPEPIVRFQVP